MKEYTLTEQQLQAFDRHLLREECSPGTIDKYLRDTRAFLRWLEGRPVTREAAARWKAQLVEAGYAPVTVNSMLSALNRLFLFLGWSGCRVKFLKIQRRLFRDSSRELTRTEYERLLSSARTLGQERLALIMETVFATGIRVSEVRYITVQAARTGRAEIALKGKVRVILLPAKLCRKLLKYAGGEKLSSGPIFRTGSGREIGRRQIWWELKGLCARAGVEPSKVFPHNLRHLFATVFYRAFKDIARRADVLGHSSIETTRIYLVTSGKEHQRQLEQLVLVS